VLSWSFLECFEVLFQGKLSNSEMAKVMANEITSETINELLPHREAIQYGMLARRDVSSNELCNGTEREIHNLFHLQHRIAIAIKREAECGWNQMDQNLHRKRVPSVACSLPPLFRYHPPADDVIVRPPTHKSIDFPLSLRLSQSYK